jgi:YidC/Oxa1 family membrane protein insertase
MFTTFIVQPIFNVLTLIYALLPSHNFGLAIIIFTVLTRFALYPLLKKQLRHTKAMRELQPEIKKIKAQTKGNKQQESAMMMELYKEREIKPLSYMGLMIIQIVLFFALFSGLNKVVNDPQQLYDFSYPFIQNLQFMQDFNNGVAQLDNTLFGFIDLSRAAIGEAGFYFPAFLLVLGSAVVQFFQIRQTMPQDKDARKLREILKSAGEGKQADNAEVSAAMTRNMAYILPIFIFIVTISFPAALALYWFVGGLIAYMQQAYLLKKDEEMMEGTATVVSKKPLSEKSSAKSSTKKTTKQIAEKSVDKPKSKPIVTDSGVKVTVLSEEAKKQANPTKQKSKSSKKNRKKRRR